MVEKIVSLSHLIPSLRAANGDHEKTENEQYRAKEHDWAASNVQDMGKPGLTILDGTWTHKYPISIAYPERIPTLNRQNV